MGALLIGIAIVLAGPVLWVIGGEEGWPFGRDDEQ